MPAASKGWSQVSCDRTFKCTALSLAAVAARGGLHRGEDAPLARQEAAMVLATIVLLLLSFTPTYTHGTRRWAVAAYRLLACALLPPGSGQSAVQLQHAAASPFVDAMRALLGSRALMLNMLSLGLPLDLPDYLPVQLLCLALLLRTMHTCCDQPLLANPTQRRRIAALHAAAAGCGGLYGSPAQLLGGPQAQCTSALSFLLLFCGGVLPTIAVMRWTWLSLKAASRINWQAGPRHSQPGGSTPLSSSSSLNPSGSLSLSSSPDPSGSLNSSGSLSLSPADGSCALSGDAAAAYGGEAVGSDSDVCHVADAPDAGQLSPRALPDCWLCTAAAAQQLPRWSVWVLEQAFPPVQWLPAMLAATYLPLLAAACWLAACALALATASPAV